MPIMKTFMLSVAALVAAALPLAAQQHQPDHDKAIAGGGTLPAGWKGRIDDGSAIRKPDASGKMSNTLAVEVGREKVRFLVNGTEVASADPSKVDAAGIAGLRVNHNLNVHVEGFTVRAR